MRLRADLAHLPPVQRGRQSLRDFCFGLQGCQLPQYVAEINSADSVASHVPEMNQYRGEHWICIKIQAKLRRCKQNIYCSHEHRRRGLSQTHSCTVHSSASTPTGRCSNPVCSFNLKTPLSGCGSVLRCISSLQCLRWKYPHSAALWVN